MKIRAIGIDFGTTNCVIAECSSINETELLTICGKTIIPTIINYNGEKIRFGDHFGDGDISSIKRKIGSNEQICERTVAEVCSDIFSEIKSELDRIVINEQYKTVITVPAYFNDVQRNIVKMSAQQSGLEVLMILNEPTAAILSKPKIKPGIYMVYDFGGGTFDVSIISYSEGIFQVLGTCGDTALGGDDIDEAIAERFNMTIVDARHAKETNQINTDEIRDIYAEFAHRTIEICSELIGNLNSRIDKVDHIIMVGGSSYLGVMQKAVKDRFKVKPKLVDPETSVARGAAMKAYHIINKTNHILIDVNPLTLGVETFGGGVDPIIRRNSRIPCMKSEVYTDISDKQKYLIINIVQGESRWASECTSIGKIRLKINRSNEAIKPRFSVEFKINEEGILNVRASQLGTSVAKEIIINPNYGLTKARVVDEIKRVYNAEQNIAEQLAKDSAKKAIDMTNVVRQAMDEDPDLLSPEERKNIDAKIEEINKSVNTPDSLMRLCQELEMLTNDFAEKRIRRILELARRG